MTLPRTWFEPVDTRQRQTFVIAEAGVNHNGDVELALELVRAAKRSGADCVKFQTFKAERVATNSAPKASYQLKVTPAAESQLDMLKKLELSPDHHQAIYEECRNLNILFLSTPYSDDDAEFLHRLGVEAFKIASGQIVELSFLRHVAGYGKPIVLSTGMATLGEVDTAVRTIRESSPAPLILLQCTTNYPSAIEDANLLTIPAMHGAFTVDVGYSDHTMTPSACLAAVALGATVIEKHLTLDKTMAGPDHASSASPDEFAALVRSIREVEVALGNGVKRPTAHEIANLPGMRRSIVARTPIKRGEIITLGKLTFKRPASGISPSRIDEILGAMAARDLPGDHIVQWSDVTR